MTTAQQDCPSSQEPKITGNSGNTGNGQSCRGFQALPPYKKSGNNWQHTPDIQHKRAPIPRYSLITVAGHIGTGNTLQSWRPRRSGLLPVLPLLPVFLKSQEHWIKCNSAGVAP